MSRLSIIRLTSSGRGAVGSFRLCGEDAMNTFLQYWCGNKPVGDHPTFGRLQLSDNGDCEEAVAHCTTDGGLEIHIHGGEQIASVIETLFLQSGAVRKTWQEHLASGSSQKEIALRLLPFAPTERTAQILLDQYNGAYNRETAAMEQLTCEEECKRRLARLQELVPLGQHLVEPFRVVLAGASNAGKSSLLNAILGFQRSLVDSMPGTTRDVVSGQTALDGFPVTFFDTAGFRITDNELELQGIDRSLGSFADANLIVWVIDSTVEESMRPPCPVESNVLSCYNKIDLTNINLSSSPVLFGTPAIGVSALTSEGIESFLGAIIRRLVPSPPTPGEAVPLT